MNDRFFFNLFLVLVSFVLSLTGVLFLMRKMLVKRGLYVFNYHSFSTLENDYWKYGSLFASNYRRRFEKQIMLFDKLLKGIDTFELDTLSLDEPRYLVTFDDGYKDSHEIGFPMLVKHAIPTALFIATGPLGTDGLLWYDEVRYRFEKKARKRGWGGSRAKKELKKELAVIKKQGFLSYRERLKGGQDQKEDHGPLMMDWDEVRAACRQGIQIGCHTRTHPILAQLAQEDQETEIKISMEEIQSETGYRPFYFAYPQGDSASFDRETVRLLKEQGIRYAFTTIPGVNFDFLSPYRLKRIGIKASDPIPVVKLKLIVASMMEKLKKNRVLRFREQLRQYGFWPSLRRAGKKVLRVLGVYYESYYVLHRFLDGEINTSPLPGDAEVIKVSYQDFEESPFHDLFPQTKRDLYKERFSSGAYEAFGVKRGGKLVYLTWIATDSLDFEYFGYEIKLQKHEGVLVDSIALPEARRLGLHMSMNGYRLKRLKEKGIHKVYGAVITENIPAIKTQIKHGLDKGEKITGLRVGKRVKIFRKNINWDKLRKK